MELLCVGNIEDLKEASQATLGEFRKFANMGVFHNELFSQAEELYAEYERTWIAARPLLPTCTGQQISCLVGASAAPLSQAGFCKPAQGDKKTSPLLDKLHRRLNNDGLESEGECQLRLTL